MTNGRPHVLVVGSFVMDLTVKADRFPDSGETILGNDFHTSPGGKGFNQAVQAARLGAQVTMVGCVGDDANGKQMLNVAKEEGIDTQHIRVEEGVPSAIGNILLFPDSGSGVQNRIIVVPGANMRLTVDDVAFLQDTIDQYDAVMLQLEIPMEVNEAVAAYAFAANVPVMLNPAPAAELSDSMLRNVAFLLPNETEAAMLSGISIKRAESGVDCKAVREAARVLMDRGVKQVLVTLGDSGSAYFSDGKSVDCPCVQNVVSADPTAAGDSYIAAFTVSTASGATISHAMEFASATAAITVSRLGGQPSLPMLSEIDVDCF